MISTKRIVQKFYVFYVDRWRSRCRSFRINAICFTKFFKNISTGL
jgi:hypothetical protein